MLRTLEDGTIELTRGDTARLTIVMHNDSTNDEYTMDENDNIKFTVKKKCKDISPLMQKTSKGSGYIHIEPTDTSDIPFGEYVYDVQLETHNGDVYTVITPSTFKLMEEVSW